MSAFVVSTNTINAIVSFSVGGHRRIVTCKRIDDPAQLTVTTEYTPSQIGQALIHENFLSVNYRYRTDDETPVYRFRPVWSGRVKPGTVRLLTPIDIIKLAHCLEYQSCEHPTWHASFAKDFLERVTDAATRSLPGYEKAPWGLCDREAA